MPVFCRIASFSVIVETVEGGGFVALSVIIEPVDLVNVFDSMGETGVATGGRDAGLPVDIPPRPL